MTWGIDISCLACGADALERLTGSTNGVLAVTIVRCGSCNRQYELTTRMRLFVHSPKRKAAA